MTDTCPHCGCTIYTDDETCYTDCEKYHFECAEEAFPEGDTDET